MAIYTIFVFIAIVAQLCSGSGKDHASEVNTFVKRHSDVMTKEIEQRLNQGFKRSIAAHRSKKMMFELIPSTEPTSPPTDASTTEDVPTIAPTAEPTENPDLSSTGYYYLTNSFSSDCSSPVVSWGFSVNTCFLVNDTSVHSYKIRIVDGKPPPHFFAKLGFPFLIIQFVQTTGPMRTPTITATHSASS